MKTVLWIITVCEVVITVQNFVQIMTIRHNIKGRDNANTEFMKSLKQSDRDIVRRMLYEFEMQEGE